MAGRLLNLRPLLKSDLTISVSVDNHMVASELSGMRTHIEEYLRHQLQNSQITLNVVVDEVESAHRIYSRIEQYQALESRNPALRKLKESLNLDLD